MPLLDDPSTVSAYALLGRLRGADKVNILIAPPRRAALVAVGVGVGVGVSVSLTANRVLLSADGLRRVRLAMAAAWGNSAPNNDPVVWDAETATSQQDRDFNLAASEKHCNCKPPRNLCWFQQGPQKGKRLPRCAIGEINLTTSLRRLATASDDRMRRPSALGRATMFC